MPTRATVTGFLAVALCAAACYQDDTTPAAPGVRPLVTVRLTDAPFPYDSVASVNLYIVRIEASTGNFGDSTPSGDWVVITQPRKSVNLLAFQRGTTAFLGEGDLPGGLYHEIRMTIDTSLSSIIFNSGAKAAVDWRNHSGTNEMPIYAFVQYPVNVPTEGAEIVLDFDVGRSFLFDYFGQDSSFTLFPQLRAVNTAGAGAIVGTVTTNSGGGTVPLKDASVEVCDSACSGGTVIATGLSDAAGHYTVPFVSAGTYLVRIERIDRPDLVPVVTPNVQVRAGDTTQLSVSLTAGSNGAYVRISGPTSVGVGGSITLMAAVGDAQGNPVHNPSVTWTSSDASIATVSGFSLPDTAAATVTGRAAGFATITATSGGLKDTVAIRVIAPTSNGSVATVTMVPESASVSLNDTLFQFQAQLRDSAGNLLSDRPVSWFSTDTTVFVVHGYGSYGSIQPRGVGTAFVRATSEGKTGQAKVNVTAPAPVATVTVQPGSASLTVGDSAGFTAVLKDAAGNTLSNRAVAWSSSDPSVLSITATYGAIAYVRASGAGTASLRATSEGKTGQATVTVAAPAPVATVTVVPGSASLKTGDSATFTADLRDAAGNALSNRAVAWSSSDPSVLSIMSAYGASVSVRAAGAGTAVLRATSEGKTGQATVTVAAPAPVATVTVVPESASVALSDTFFTFQAQLRDSAGNVLTGRAVSWASTDNSVFVVLDPGYGNIQPRGVGTAFIHATSEGKTGQAKVVVH
ncbi:MAG TPA: DUF4382 domain-containing protein [Gemmatimonadales bacterium]|nr:DUF4382 domain-containing protein [Gemmatimonadales bacterium]